MLHAVREGMCVAVKYLCKGVFNVVVLAGQLGLQNVREVMILTVIKAGKRLNVQGSYLLLHYYFYLFVCGGNTRASTWKTMSSGGRV